MLKEKLLSYIKEQTKQVDFDHVDKSCTADEMSGIFTVKRNTVSHYLNKEVGKSLFKVNTRPVLFFDAKVFEERFFKPEKPVYASLEELFMEHTEAERKSREADDPLESMIGARGSLKKAIEQIKTSVFYPNTSLPVFLHGDTGAGKSYMARQIYEFSVCHGVLPEGAPFITLNCAQYANNVELLSSNLFGYVKGAFTGAYGTSKGLLEAADGGMLFLDEVHRLNNESQEKLFIFWTRESSAGWEKVKGGIRQKSGSLWLPQKISLPIFWTHFCAGCLLWWKSLISWSGDTRSGCSLFTAFLFRRAGCWGEHFQFREMCWTRWQDITLRGMWANSRIPSNISVPQLTQK